MTVKLYTVDGRETTPQQLLEDLAKQHWIGLDTFISGLVALGKEKNIPDDTIEDHCLRIGVAYATVTTHIIEFSQNLTFISTPYASLQMMLSTILELLFSAMICEKQFYGEQFSGEDAQKEFMAVAYQHANQVLNDISNHINKGTFQQRVDTSEEAAANAPTTLTRQ